MQEFAEKFRKAVTDSGISIAALSMGSEISTAMLYKIQNGSRMPDSVKTLERILDIMHCSEEEHDELLRAYKIERIGSVRWEGFEELKLLLTDLAILPKVNASAVTPDWKEIPPVIRGSGNVNGIVQYLFQKEASRAGGHIRIYMPLTYQIGFECLARALHSCHPDFHVAEHVVKLRASAESEALLYNLKTLRSAMPKMLETERYQFYYGYTNPQENVHGAFPYYIITSDGVLMISADFISAIFLSQPEIIREFSFKYEEMCKQYRRGFVLHPVSFESHCESFFEERRAYHGRSQHIFAAPLPIMSAPKLIEKYIPEDSRRKAGFDELMQSGGLSTENQSYDLWFTLEGMMQLIEDGKPHMSRRLDMPVLDRADILSTLRNYIEQVKLGSAGCHILRKSFLPTDTSVSANLYGNHLKLYCERSSGETVMADIVETTLPLVLADYLSQAEWLGDAFSTDESIRIVESVLRRYHA